MLKEARVLGMKHAGDASRPKGGEGVPKKRHPLRKNKVPPQIHPFSGGGGKNCVYRTHSIKDIYNK